jgi:hypothetical protein
LEGVIVRAKTCEAVALPSLATSSTAKAAAMLRGGVPVKRVPSNCSQLGRGAPPASRAVRVSASRRRR